jgi:hypothetical protein
MEGNKQPLIMPVKAKSVVGKEPNDPKPGHSGLKTPVMMEDDEMAMDNPLSFSAFPSSKQP